MLDKVFFVKHLSIMIKSGLSLHEGILTIREQTDSKQFKKILDDVLKHLDNGESLGSSLARHPQVFSELFVNMIRVGEASGTLEENLNHLAEQLKKSYELRRKIKAAMIYPVIILVATSGLIGGLSIFILPRLIPLFKSFDIELPLPTRILMGFVEALQNYGIFILLGLIGFIMFLVFILQIKKVKRLNDGLILKLPITSPISRSSNLVQFTMTLGTLLKSGISVVEALDISAGTIGNLVYREEIQKAASEIEKGKTISAHLKLREDLFPPTAFRMIEVGEKTGSLEDSLLYLAKFYEEEVDNLTKNLSTVFEPILLLVIGIVVGFVAVSIILPIYKITGGLHG